jgi:pimeloyl-ACP methyl ester carboxylesterase
MRRRFPAIAAAIGLLGATMTGVAMAPTVAAFAPTLDFVDCPADAQPREVECAELTVPLDWRSPEDGRTTMIALRVIRSRGNGGGFTFNPGGPGGSGIEAGPFIYRQLPGQIRDRFDFVMWDPRGVGLSGPKIFGCEDKPQFEPPETGPVDWEQEWSAFAVATGTANADCFAKNPDSAPYLGTWNVVRDLDAMRTALGYPRWNYWGMSYGTRIGYTYAKTFPDNLRTMIIDGSLWPQESIFRLASQQPAAWNTALQVYSSVMGRAQARKLEQTLAALDDPAVDPDQRTITRWGLTRSVFNRLGSQDSYPSIKRAINSAYAAIVSKPTARSRLTAALAIQDLEDAFPDPSEQYLFSFINCADLHDRPSPEVAGRLAAGVAREYGTTMPLATATIHSCMGLPADYSPGVPRDRTTITLPTPPVVVAALGDTQTPWIWGRTMANQYAGSRTITYNSSQHVSYLQTPSTCVNDRVTRYVVRRDLPPRNISCAFTPTSP